MLNVIKKYKCKNGEAVIRNIAVKDEAEKVCAYLIPVTKLIFEYPDIIEKLVEWRRDNPTVSNNYFEVTRVGTENWIEKVILEDDKKIFFIIVDKAGTPIGEMGISNLNVEESSGFIYSVIKGDKTAPKGIMEKCLKTMLFWGQKELKLSRFYLDVQETNERAIALYKRIGFEVIKKIPLEKKVSEKDMLFLQSFPDVYLQYTIVSAFLWHFRMPFRDVVPTVGRAGVFP